VAANVVLHRLRSFNSAPTHLLAGFEGPLRGGEIEVEKQEKEEGQERKGRKGREKNDPLAVSS